MGTGTGYVLHESRFREIRNPQQYYLYCAGVSLSAAIADTTLFANSDEITAPVTFIDFNPFRPEIFLVSYESGELALFNEKNEDPFARWRLEDIQLTEKQSFPVHALQIQWSSHRPSVFYVLDNYSRMHVWDLSENFGSSSHIVEFGEGVEPNKGVKSFALSPTIVSAVSSISMLNLSAASSKNATLTLAFHNGDVEIHSLNEELCETSVSEEDLFSSFFEPKKVK